MPDETVETTANIVTTDNTSMLGVPAAPPGTVVAPPPPPPVETDEEDAWDRDRAMHTIRNLREKEKEGERAAKELADAQARLAEIEEAQKTEEEKRQERLTQLETKAAEYDAAKRTWAAERAVMQAAQDAGITDLSLTLAVLDLNDIAFDESGEVTNVAEVLSALVERHPALAVGEKPAPGRPKADTRAGRAGADGPKLTAEEAKMAERVGMSPSEYAKYKGTSTTADQFANGKDE